LFAKDERLATILSSMKTSYDSVMFGKLVENLPPGFAKAVSHLIRRGHVAAWQEYAEHPRLGPAEKESVFRVMRRGLIETDYRETSNSFGLEASVEALCVFDDANVYTKVRAGRFIFSCHHVEAGALPRFANYRKQNKSVNQFLEQLLLFPDETIDRGSPIYAYFLHSSDPANKHEVGEIRVTVPAAESGGAICSYPIGDLIDAQTGSAIARSDEDLQITRKGEQQAG
jgi:hypothetical protein